MPAVALVRHGVAVAVGLVLLAACASEQDAGPPTTEATVEREPEDAAMAAGGRFLAGELDRIDPASLAIVAFLHRAFGLDDLRDARSRALAAPDPDEPEQSLLLRLLDGDRELPPRPPGYADPDFTYDVMVRALHCDQVALPPNWLAASADLGANGYALSHYAYALAWVDDLGCDVAGSDAERDRVGSALAASLEGAVVEDVMLTYGAGLVALGRGGDVPRSFVDDVLAAQNEDGGWPRLAGEPLSDWHSTGLAIWVLGGHRAGRLPSMLAWI